MVAALASILVLAGRGDGSSNPKQASHRSAFVALSKCMRSHGATNFPDPVNGGGIQLPDGFDTQSPAFKTAQGISPRLLPGRGSPKASAARLPTRATPPCACAGTESRASRIRS
jgi:hypothetical protein